MQNIQVLPRFLIAAGDGDVKQLRDIIHKHGLGHVDASSPAGETALMAACRSGHGSAVRFLVEVCSAKIDTRFPHCGDGWTALMFAGYFGRVGIVRYLVEQGADFTLRNSDNLTVLEVTPCANATLADVQEAVALGMQLRSDVAEEAVVVSYAQIAADAAGTGAGGQRFGPDASVGAGVGGASGAASSSASAGAGALGALGGAAGATGLHAGLFGAGGSDAADALAAWRGRVPVIAGTTDITAARPRLAELYGSVCEDFGVPADAAVLAAIADASGDIPESGLGALALGRWQKSAAKLGDERLLPLLEGLSHAFPSYPIHTLDLSYTGLGDAAARPLAAFVAATRSLVALNLEGNHIGPRGAALLAQALAQQPSVQHVNLAWNPLEDAGACALADALAAGGNSTLIALELGNTHMGVLSVIKYASLLRARQPPLARLTLDAPLHSSAGEEAVAAIARALPSAAVSSLSLAKFQLTDGGARLLAQALAQNASLAELSLRCNRVTATGAAALARALRARPGACFVNLDANLLREQALDELYEALDTAAAAGGAGAGALGGYGVGLSALAGEDRCEVQFITDEPLDAEEVDRFQAQRHCLVSRPLAMPE
jgi:hypothetical protein